MGYVSVAVSSKTPSGVAGFLWNQWQLSCGMSGSFAMESVAGLAWNTQAAPRARGGRDLSR